jgi:hypothetical protein
LAPPCRIVEVIDQLVNGVDDFSDGYASRETPGRRIATHEPSANDHCRQLRVLTSY